jgi:hypothetical protein
VGYGGTEQGHDAIPGVLVNGAFETVYLCGDQLEAAIDDLVHLLRVELLGQGREASHIGKQDGNLAAFPFQGTTRVQDLLGQVRRCVALALCLRGVRTLRRVASSVSSRRWGSGQGRAALATELERGLILGTTAGTLLGELSTALAAEFHRRRIVELTA